MNQTHRLLQYIVENARLGADACRQLLNRSDDRALRDEISHQLKQYEKNARDAEKMLADRGIEARPKGPMARMSMWMGMQMDTIMDKSPGHIADMLIQGSTMGIVEITKARNSCPDADVPAHDIAAGLIAFQQDAIDRLKAFLIQQPVVK